MRTQDLPEFKSNALATVTCGLDVTHRTCGGVLIRVTNGAIAICFLFVLLISYHRHGLRANSSRKRLVLCGMSKGRKEMFYLTTHSTH